MDNREWQWRDKNFSTFDGYKLTNLTGPFVRRSRLFSWVTNPLVKPLSFIDLNMINLKTITMPPLE